MANNYILPQFLASFLNMMRDQTLISRQVNRDFADTPAGTGEVITVTLPSAYEARLRTPGATPTQGQDSTPRTVGIPLDQWVAVDMYITDTQWISIQRGQINPQMVAMAEALANKINTGILDKVRSDVSATAGTASESPFETNEVPFLDALKLLDDRNVPKSGRFAVVRNTDYYKALRVPNLVQADRRGDDGSSNALRTGRIELIHGATLNQSSLVARQATNPTGAGAITVQSQAAAGASSVVLAKGAGAAWAAKAGDILQFAGHSTRYVVMADAALAASGTAAFTLSPALEASVASGEAVTVTPAHTCNLVAHRDSLYLASRALSDFQGAANTFSMPDEQTGLTYRVEIQRQEGQSKLTVDVLFGVKAVRPEMAVRLLAPPTA